MSILSILAGVGLAGMVYGLTFVPSASLARPDDEVSLGLVDKVAADTKDTSDRQDVRA